MTPLSPVARLHDNESEPDTFKDHLPDFGLSAFIVIVSLDVWLRKKMHLDTFIGACVTDADL